LALVVVARQLRRQAPAPSQVVVVVVVVATQKRHLMQQPWAPLLPTLWAQVAQVAQALLPTMGRQVAARPLARCQPQVVVVASPWQLHRQAPST